MSEEKSTVSLPTELISEKTFYTLGGASAAVFLTCWAINYVAVDVKWLDYKAYRLIAIILSEALAIYIMYKNKKKESMRWLFAFLNGLLIFMNTSGLNSMTSSYFNPPADTTGSNKRDGGFIQAPGSKQVNASLFPLPRMIDWWPDEELITQTIQLVEENRSLDSANQQMRSMLVGSEEERNKRLLHQQDSLGAIVNSLSSQLSEKQTQIDNLITSSQGSSDELKNQLRLCIREKDQLIDTLAACKASNVSLTNTLHGLRTSLNTCQTDLSNCNRDKITLNKTITNLNRRLTDCIAQSPTLTQLLQQVCNKNPWAAIRQTPGAPVSRDNLLKQRDFFKKVDWKTFCDAFNVWNNQIE